MLEIKGLGFFFIWFGQCLASSKLGIGLGNFTGFLRNTLSHLLNHFPSVRAMSRFGRV